MNHPRCILKESNMRLTKIRYVMVIASTAMVIMIGSKTDTEEMSRIEVAEVVEVVDKPTATRDILPIAGISEVMYNIDATNITTVTDINDNDIEPVGSPQIEERTMYVIVDKLNIRKEPDKNSEIIDTLMKGDMIVVCNDDEWLQSIDLDDGEPVYVYGEYLSEEEPEILNYTDSELDLLAHLIYSENGTEGELCMMYTGSVVLNRMKHEYFPDTMYDVIYQKGQYAVTWGAKAINKTPSDEAYEIAERLLKYGSVLPDNVVFQAEFSQGDGLYAQIGKTKFCYIDN